MQCTTARQEHPAGGCTIGNNGFAGNAFVPMLISVISPLAELKPS